MEILRSFLFLALFVASGTVILRFFKQRGNKIAYYAFLPVFLAVAFYFALYLGSCFSTSLLQFYIEDTKAECYTLIEPLLVAFGAPFTLAKAICMISLAAAAMITLVTVLLVVKVTLYVAERISRGREEHEVVSSRPKPIISNALCKAFMNTNPPIYLRLCCLLN